MTAARFIEAAEAAPGQRQEVELLGFVPRARRHSYERRVLGSVADDVGL